MEGGGNAAGGAACPREGCNQSLSLWKRLSQRQGTSRGQLMLQREEAQVFNTIGLRASSVLAC